MERLMHKENVYLGFGNSPKTPDSGDMDFNDVFGGPPRRFSMQEVRARYSFGETEEEDASSSPWKEKPVFGEEITPRRRHQGGDFFDDIFKGSETPRRGDRDRDSALGSNPGSRVMSPSKPLPPKSDPLATSLPAQFSLPAKLTKAMELPTFGSHSTNGLNSSSPLSRFSNEGQDEFPRQSPLSLISEDSPSSTVVSERNVGNEFHFSIYKWAGRGVPMLTPLVIGNNLKPKYEKSISSNGRMESKSPKDLKRNKDFSELKPETDNVVLVEKVDEIKKKESKSEMKKPLHAFLDQPEVIDNKTKTPERVGGGSHEKKNVKEKQAISRLKGVAKNLGGSGRKVKEFVEIFNQENGDVIERSGSFRWKNNGQQEENEVSSKAAKDEEHVSLHDLDKRRDVPLKVDETPIHSTPTGCATDPHKIFSSSETLHTNAKVSVENSDDLLEDNFMVEELSDDHENVRESESSESEDTKAIDAKIRQWSVGKKGNIRSLLSTLQYVLWAESGWKAVPLMDLIETNSVKRAYQKALLRLHPDKLQQKGAAFDQKYIAEKVFDILQEAWDHFNTSSITIS